MNALTTNTTVTMTSREIAELTGKEHKNVKRDIEKMFLELELGALSFERTYKDVQNKEQTEYCLNRELSLTLVTGYDVKRRHAINVRWIELEEKARNPIAAMSRVQLLKLALDSEEERAQLEHKVEVLTPKAAALDRIATIGNGSYCIREAAKLLNVQEKRLRQKLQEIHWIYHPPVGGNWLGYAPAREKGFVEHKRTEGDKPDGTRWESVQVRITDKGLAKLAVLLQSELVEA